MDGGAVPESQKAGSRNPPSVSGRRKGSEPGDLMQHREASLERQWALKRRAGVQGERLKATAPQRPGGRPAETGSAGSPTGSAGAATGTGEGLTPGLQSRGLHTSSHLNCGALRLNPPRDKAREQDENCSHADL